MRPEFEIGPCFRREAGHVGQFDHRAFGGVEGVVERLFQRGEIGQHRMIAVGRVRSEEIRQALREPAQVRMLGRMRLDVSVPHLVEHLVAEIEVQQFVIVAHSLDQPRAVGVAIDAEQRLALLPGAVENFGQHGVVVAQNAALKFGLLSREVAHPACLPVRQDASRRSRGSWSTSSSSSSSGGMLSSRSIMVETRPKRFKAAT